jgi:potassium/hydrogen antiporter
VPGTVSTQLIDHALLGAAVLLLGAVLASKLSNRLGIPALLLFLGLGMFAGSDGPGGIWFDDAEFAQRIGIVALAIILFSGGLETDWPAASRVLGRAVSLATIGVLLTAVLTGWFASGLLGISLTQGLLIGAIVSSTDAAAVFSVLRVQRLRLRGRLQPLLELESGSNDPMAVFLTIAFTQLLANPSTPVPMLALVFVQQMVVGGVIGLAFGKAALWAINRVRLETEGLYPVFMLAVVLLTYGATASLGGSGFLAVYIAGIIMGAGQFVYRRSVSRFTDGVSWLMQIAMFLVLGLLVFPSRLPAVAVPGAVVALFLIVIARPVGVFASLVLARMPMRYKFFVAWVGLRGAVPIVLATFPLVARVPHSELYFDLVFFVVLTSVLIQGTTIAVAARWLRVQLPVPARRSGPLDFIRTGRAQSSFVEVEVAPNSEAAFKQIVDLQFPGGALAVVVGRGDDYIVPRGSTVLQPGDVLLVLADRDQIPAVRAMASERRAAVRTGGNPADADAS